MRAQDDKSSTAERGATSSARRGSSRGPARTRCGPRRLHRSRRDVLPSSPLHHRQFRTPSWTVHYPRRILIPIGAQSPAQLRNSVAGSFEVPFRPGPPDPPCMLGAQLAHVAFEVREFTPRFSTDMNFVASSRPLGRLRSSPEVEDGEETGGKTIQSHDVLFFFPRRDFGGEFRKVFCCDLRLGWVGLAVLVLRWPEPAGPSRALEVAWEQAITSSMTCFERDSEREVWLRAKG